MERPLTRFFRHWTRTIAAAILIYFLPMAAEFWLYSPALLVPRTAAAATIDNPWGDLPDWVVLQPFPAGFDAQPKFAAWADELAFADTTTFTLRNPAGDDLLYEEASIAYAVVPYAESSGSFGPARSVGSRRETVPQGQYQYTWSGTGFSEGLYHWSYEYTPVEPPACVGPECPPEPDPGSFDPISAGGFPVIYDKTAPEISGLRHLKSNWLGVEVRDAVSVIESVQVVAGRLGAEYGEGRRRRGPPDRPAVRWSGWCAVR